MGLGSVTLPLLWNCSHSRQPITFGVHDPIGYPWGFDGVIDVDGLAAFTNDIAQNTYTVGPPCKFFATPAGGSPGLYDNEIHVVTSIGTDGTIYTTTPFIGDENRTNGICMTNLTYRMYYTDTLPFTTSYIDIKPFWKSDGEMLVNLAEYLKSIFPFPIPPPVLGNDVNLSKFFSVEIIPSQDFEDWGTANSVDVQAEIDAQLGGYDFMDYGFMVVKAVNDHQNWIDLYVDPSPSVPIGELPVIFSGGVNIFSILNESGDGIRNVISLP